MVDRLRQMTGIIRSGAPDPARPAVLRSTLQPDFHPRQPRAPLGRRIDERTATSPRPGPLQAPLFQAAPQAQDADSTGTSTKYTKAGPRFEDSFCSNLDALQAVLKFNEIKNFKIFDAAEADAKLTSFTEPYDFIYSFFAVGFHWSINHFLDEILRLMDERSLGAFTLHDRFTDFSALADGPHRVVEFRRSWPPGRFTRMLVLSKTAEGLQDAA